MLSFGCSPQEALDAPRIVISPHETANPNAIVHVEFGVPPETIVGLKKLGHNITVETGFGRCGYFGRGQIVRARRKDKDEGEGWVYSAGSDPRGDGAALAFSG
jgi:gamma-glutamyltranspeptidase / glutathione hydrolase